MDHTVYSRIEFFVLELQICSKSNIRFLKTTDLRANTHHAANPGHSAAVRDRLVENKPADVTVRDLPKESREIYINVTTNASKL